MIVWNKVTWYSRYLAVAFFTLIFPVWAFYLGVQYGKTTQEIQSVVIEIPKKINSSPSTTTPQKELDSGIKGTVTIGPTCPVETTPPTPGCEAKPYAADLVAIERKSAKQTKFSSSDDGKFLLDLPPGDYSIRNDSTAVLPRMENYEITVREGQYTEIDIKFDSGIR